MEKLFCDNCKYFIQHYVFLENKLTQVCCGHCFKHRIKKTRPDKKACEHFAQGQKDTDRFVNKEYLNKRLLDRILEMELLPEFEDMATSGHNLSMQGDDSALTSGKS